MINSYHPGISMTGLGLGENYDRYMHLGIMIGFGCHYDGGVFEAVTVVFRPSYDSTVDALCSYGDVLLHVCCFQEVSQAFSTKFTFSALLWGPQTNLKQWTRWRLLSRF